MTGVGFHFLASGPNILPVGMKIAKYVNCDPPVIQPAPTVIWRWVEHPDNINDLFGKNPEEEAGKWVTKQWEHIQHVPKYAFIEGPNENRCDNLAEAQWFSRFEIQRMKLMEAKGYRCAIGCFGTGRPHLPTDDGGVVWTALRPMLKYAKDNGHILALHEYAYTLDTWNLLRYRKVYDFLPQDSRPLLVISEWGLDGSKGAFRDNTWRIQHSDPDQVYFNLIKAYDLEIQKDPYVLGFTIFTHHSDGNWDRFNIENQPVVSKVLAYVEGNVTKEIYPQIDATKWGRTGTYWGKLHVAPHMTPTNVYDEAKPTSMVLWTMPETSAWWYISDLAWDDNRKIWWFKIEPNETGLGPKGWMRNKFHAEVGSGRWDLDIFGNFGNDGPPPITTPIPVPDPNTPIPEPPISLPFSRVLNVIDVAFWEIIKDQNTGIPVDHRNTIFADIKELNAKVNIGLGLVDVVQSNGKLDFSWYDSIIFNGAIRVAMIMIDTLPSHLNANGRPDRTKEAEYRQAFRGIVNHYKSHNSRWSFMNEPDWAAEELVWLFDIFCEEALIADPTCRIACATPLSQGGAIDHTTPFVSKILRLSKGKFHAWSIHPYEDDNNDADLNSSMLELVHTIDPKRTIWVTEWGHSKDKLVPHWNDSPEQLKMAEEKQRSLFLSGFNYIKSKLFIELASYHRLYDLPWNSYGMISRAVWDGNTGHKFLIYHAAKQEFSVLTTEEPPIPMPEPTSTNTIFREDFEEDWTTNPVTGNQTPKGWKLEFTPNNTANIIATKNQQGRTVPSVAKVEPECVHKKPSQLPDLEQRGKFRALLLGSVANVYKCFGKDSWSLSLSNSVIATVGRRVRVSVYILGETPDRPTTPAGLEMDHFRASVGSIDRLYADMKARKDVPGNDRNWNLFRYELNVPSNGQVPIVIKLQQNWAGVTDFFIGPVTVEYIDNIPTPVPDPVTNKLEEINAQLRVLRGLFDLVQRDAENLRFTLDSFVAEMNELDNLVNGR